ncbi:GvpL/GvpF family gas vesicle protein [Streptomyces sp. HD]|uniref:GvpL/GvpF family gas vesicle protein n=1 Tax=Streptomyces sp. HD TaxID=3020892 RepID=UPI00232C58F5|nr:GvpL/GvpF family gas vesicle protein [Streptomyces sp. HD]MDC0765520.1 GvpL/GvpF family gas vesicle protein [Streptomyces sp. HD]
MNGRRLSYAYAVVRSSGPTAQRAHAALADVRGVADAPVTLVRSGAVAAAVSAVPGEEFSEAALRARLEDLDWLESTARAHHLVIETLAARTTVLPLRLTTVYLDDSRVERMLSERQEAFTALLDRFDDHVEWGVKVYAEIPPASEPPPSPAAHGSSATGPADPADPADPAPGRAYLRRRRQHRQTREDTWRAAEEAVRRTEERARGLAVERARHRPQQGTLAHVPGENVANDAYLVPRHAAEEFHDRMLHAADDLPGVRVEVTGPWAPYSFTAPPEGARQR